MELFDSLGFKRKSVSRHLSAEDEIEYLHEYFLLPKYFNSVKSDIKHLNSRFIFGSRGSGKSATLLTLKTELENDKYITAIIDRFDAISLENNDSQILLKAIELIVKKLTLTLMINKKPLSKASINIKEKLSFFISNYFQSISISEYENLIQSYI